MHHMCREGLGNSNYTTIYERVLKVRLNRLDVGVPTIRAADTYQKMRLHFVLVIFQPSVGRMKIKRRQCVGFLLHLVERKRGELACDIVGRLETALSCAASGLLY